MTLALRVFLPFALAYCLAYVLRVVNAVAGEPLSAELGLGAAELGLLTSVYFAGFALCQIPLGLAMDRYGARRIEGAALLLAAAGCGLFAIAGDYGELVLGRVMMGVGASMCLMAPFTAYRRFFSAERLPMVVGLHMAFGAAGSAIGGGPTEALISVLGWREMFLLLAALVVALALSILLIVPRQTEPRGRTSLAIMLAELGTLATSARLWRIAPLAATVQAGFLAIMSLWTGPWLREVGGHSSARAALWLSVASAGLMIGFLVFGALASWAERRGRSLDVFLAGSLAYTLTLLAIIVLPPSVGTVLWLVFTVTGSSGILSYALVSKGFGADMAGRVNTALNGIVFFFAFLVQWLFGVVLNLFPDGAGGAAPLGFHVGLSALLVLQCAAFVPVLAARRRLMAPQPA